MRVLWLFSQIISFCQGLYEMFFKSGSSAWRQIISLKNINVCIVLNDQNPLPFLQDFKKHVLLLFPNLPSKCPYKPGKYYNKNVRVDNQTGVHLTNSLTNKIFANGEYRHNIRLSTPEDPQGLLMLIYHEVYERMNDETW